MFPRFDNVEVAVLKGTGFVLDADDSENILTSLKKGN
jgi:hypothetical protein